MTRWASQHDFALLQRPLFGSLSLLLHPLETLFLYHSLLALPTLALLFVCVTRFVFSSLHCPSPHTKGPFLSLHDFAVIYSLSLLPSLLSCTHDLTPLMRSCPSHALMPSRPHSFLVSYSLRNNPLHRVRLFVYCNTTKDKSANIV